MNKTGWIVFSVIVLAVLGGAVYLSMQNKLDLSDLTKEKMANIIGPEDRNGQIGDHTLGNKDAKIVLIEYADFQCPGCRSAAEESKRITEKYKDHMVFIFRSFPIPSLHPNARAAAAAAEAAGLQGKFWQMHDLLFQQQSSWSQADPSNRQTVFVNYSRDIGLDEKQFTKDMAGEQVIKKINFDVSLGKLHGVSGTPTFILNGKEIELNKEKSLESAIKEALDKAKIKYQTEEEKILKEGEN